MSYINDIRKKVGHDPIFAPASGCIIIKENKILLQQRIDDKTWAIHGGYLNLGETFYEAMKRKVKEEININPIKPKLINIYSGNDIHDIYPNKDEVYGILATYIAYDYEGTLQHNKDEVINLKWFDINDLPENIHNIDKKLIKEAILFYKKDLNL